MCRHQSSALFGAIRENNIDLVRHFLYVLNRDYLTYELIRETSFGDSVLTFAAALGRAEIIETLLNTMLIIVGDHSDTMTMSDLVNHETSRGKVAIIEAVRCYHTDVVSILLAHNANATLPSKTHKKSALDWANTLCDETMVKLINKRIHLEENVSSLFRAISKCDVEQIITCVHGGVSFERNQNALFHQELKIKEQQLDRINKKLDILTQTIKKEAMSRDALQITSARKNELMQDLANIGLQISQLKRKIQVKQVMDFVTVDGHSALSWATAQINANEKVITTLLKNGAHTAIGDDCIIWCTVIIQVSVRRWLRRRKRSLPGSFEQRNRDLSATMRIDSLSRLIRRRLASLRLPLSELLFNGNSKVAHLLDKSDLPLFQSILLSPMFKSPSVMIPRVLSVNGCGVRNFRIRENCQSASRFLPGFMIQAGESLRYDQNPGTCCFVDSFRYIIELTDVYLRRRKKATETKLRKRRETLFQIQKKVKESELRSAMFKRDYSTIVKVAEEGCISLDYEESTTGLTPLILAALEDVHSSAHKWCHNQVGEQVTAVAYVLDRISLYRPDVNYENRLGHTALTMACINGRLEAVQDLIDRGASVNRRSVLMGNTALHCASMAGKVEVCKLLLKCGIDLNVKDNSDLTAHDLAVRGRHFALAEFLHQHMINNVV